jgi:hypothetical protein
VALDKTKLATDIKAAFDAAKASASAEEAAGKLVDLLATAIESYIKSAQVAGITVTVQGAAGTQSAPVGLT